MKGMESGVWSPQHASREDRLNQLLEKAKREGLSRDSFGIWPKLTDLAQSEFSVSRETARDYAGVVMQKLPLKSQS